MVVQTLEEWMSQGQFHSSSGHPRAKRSDEIQEEADPDDCGGKAEG